MPKNQMTTNQNATLALNKLTAWKGNVRKTGAKEGLDELAASIAAHGLLQSLIVREAPDGDFAVIAGRRRLMALKSLAKAGKLAADFPVPCRIVADDADAAEIGLAENIVRVAMHPADQFEAFRAVIDNGATIADVAVRFGVSEDIVQKRLKLGRLSPVILAAYRTGDLGLEQAQAFALSDDTAAQEAVYAGLPEYQRSPGHIRRALTQGEVPATDKRVRLVGIDAYREAGGILRRDLFADDNHVYLQDAALLDRLVREKLEATAVDIRGEGWSWVEIAPAFDYADAAKFGTAHSERVNLPKKDRAALNRLCKQYDKLAEGVDPHADEDAAINTQLAELQAQIDVLEAKTKTWPAETLALAGAIVTIDYDGNVEVRRGLIRPEDVRATKAGAKAKAAGETPARTAATLSTALVTDLTAHRSAAISAVLCEKPDIALAAVVHALMVNQFHAWSGGSCLQFSVQSINHESFVADLAACKGFEALNEALHRCDAQKPCEPTVLWQWCLDQTRNTLLDLLALFAACAVDAVLRKGERPDDDRMAHADMLAKSLSLSMSDWYTATADGYFSRISKPQIIDAYRQAKGTDPAPAWLKLKKSELAKRVAKALAGTGWLPEPLHTAEGDAQPEPVREAAE